MNFIGDKEGCEGVDEKAKKTQRESCASNNKNTIIHSAGEDKLSHKSVIK
jgi:hypothetical protein